MARIISNKWSIWDIMLFGIIIILLIMIMTRIFRHSATEIQIYLGFISGFLIITGFIIKSLNNFSNLNREVGEIKINMKNSFEKVRIDINNLKSEVRADINNLKNDIKKLGEKL